MGCREIGRVGVDQRTLCFHTMSLAPRLCQGDLLLHLSTNSIVISAESRVPGSCANAVPSRPKPRWLYYLAKKED